jgi:hypothetical protein
METVKDTVQTGLQWHDIHTTLREILSFGSNVGGRHMDLCLSFLVKQKKG